MGDPQLMSIPRGKDSHMNNLKHTIRKFVSDERGLETVEYAVMTALVVAALVAAITALSGAVVGRFGDTQATVEGIN